MTRKAATAAVILATSGLIAGGTTLGSAAPAAHHKFTKVHYTAKTVSVEQIDQLDSVTNVRLRSRHVARAGSIQGSAAFTCHRKNVNQQFEHCRGALALKQGMMYVNARLPFTTFELSGDITGGAGIYKHATGTLVAVIGDTKKASLMTIKYRIKRHH